MKLGDLKIYFRMLFRYRPKTFWNQLLSDSFDLRGVGHFRLSNTENLKMYEEKKKLISNELKKCNIIINDTPNVLEIGCGVGYWTEYLKSLGVKKYTGNDIAEISVTKLKEIYPEYNFIQGDISELPLPAENYDIVLMIDVTQHITDDSKFDHAMRNIWGSLRHNSYFIVTIWDPSKKVYLANKLRINRIEKPRSIELYKKIFGSECEVLSYTDFNDKYLVIIKKK